MAIYYARKSGNVNAADVWATTPSGTASDVFSTFTNQDTLMANNFTITLNVNTTVLEVRTDNSNGSTSGGGFTLSSGVTLNANVYAGTTNCVTFSSASPASATINGNINSTTGTNIGGVICTSTGTLNINGSVSGGSVQSAGAYLNGNGILNIVGSVVGGSSNNAMGVMNQSSTGTVNITGSVIGGTNFGASGAYNSSGATINIIGNAVSNVGPGVTNFSIGSVNLIGVAIGNISAGAVNNSTGTLTVTRAKGNGFGPGSVGITSQVGISNSQTGTAKVYEIEYGDLGQSPTSGPIELVTANSNVAVFAVRLSTKKTLVDLNNATNLIPASGNVRSGISYNYGNNTGSCVIPNSNSVVYGVPVDNTVGSGLLSPVAVWNALTSSIATSGSIGERLKNCSTVSTVGKQLEGVL